MRRIKRILLSAIALFSFSVMSEAAQNKLQVGEPFPALTFPDLDGNPKSIADFQGRKTILHIFASW